MRILGVDVGGTKIEITGYDEKFYHIKRIPSNEDNLKKLNSILINEAEGFGAEAIGIGIAGWLEDRRVVKAPNLRYKDFQFNLPVPFILENDANCFAYGVQKLRFPEILYMAGITVGTGIGMGLILNGKLFRGRGKAGEIGHSVIHSIARIPDMLCVCGGRNHLECYFSGWSLEKKYDDFKRVIKENSEQIFREKGYELFIQEVTHLVTILDLELVAIGGGIGNKLSQEIVKRDVNTMLPPPFTCRVEIIKEDGMVAKGAALLAEDMLNKE